MGLPEALDDVRSVFAARKAPATIDACPHCWNPEELDRLLRTPREDLTSRDLNGPLGDAYHLWGEWPALAYFIPRILELVISGELDDEMLYNKLLIASRPKLSPGTAIGDPMNDAERRALHSFLIAWLEVRRGEAYARTGWPEGLVELFAAVAALDGPIEGLVHGWKEGGPEGRGFWCGILNGLIDSGYPRTGVLPNLYLDRCLPHPANVALLNRETEIEPATLYLLDHLDAIPLYGHELLVTVERTVGIR